MKNTKASCNTYLRHKVTKVIAMQDNNEKTIPVGGERTEEMMHEREEGGGWEPNSKDIHGFDMSMVMSHLKDPHHTFFEELNIELLSEKGMVTL